MYIEDITLTVSNWALNIEKQRATIAASNISNANTGAAKQVADFSELLKSVPSYSELKQVRGLVDSLPSSIDIEKIGQGEHNGRISLDEEVTTLSRSSGRYKVIAEAVARKFAMQTIASRGK